MSSWPTEIQGVLASLSGEASEDAVALLARVGDRLDRREALRFVTDAFPELTSPYIAAAGDLAATIYEELPGGVAGFRAVTAALPPVAQLGANGRYALLSGSASVVDGVVARVVNGGFRDSTLANLAAEYGEPGIAEHPDDSLGTLWARHASANACGFCRMLATRSAVYRSQRSASRVTGRGVDLTVSDQRAIALGQTTRAEAMQRRSVFRSAGQARRFGKQVGDSRASGRTRGTRRLGDKFHDYCRCVAVAVRPGGSYQPAPYVEQWEADYIAASDSIPNGTDYKQVPRLIAAHMEQAGAERLAARRIALPNDLDAPAATAARERVAGAPRLTERNAVRAEQVAQPVADRVAQAAAIADRADELVSTAARVTGQVKKATDVADKLLGAQYPAIRSVKTLVDAADKGLRAANKVTGGAVEVAKVADRTLKDTVSIAHGVRQIADEAGGVLDEAAAIALGVRALATDAGKAVADIRGADGAKDFAERIGAAVDTAAGFQAEGAALVERARATVAASQNVVQGVAELPDMLRRPVADMQELAQTVREVAADVELAGADAAAAARSVRRLVDALRDYRRAEATVADAARSPIRVASERLDVDGPRALPAGASDARALPAGDRLPAVIEDQAPAGTGGARTPIRVHSERLNIDPSAIEAPSRQRALSRPQGPTALDSGRQPLMLTAAPERLAIEAPKIPAPDRGAIAEWLQAEQAHRDALEAWRRVDAEPLLPSELIPDVPAPRTVGDALREAVDNARAAVAEPDERRSASAKQKQQRREARALALKQAERDLAAAEADGSAADVLVVKAKRAKARPAAVIEAERVEQYDADMLQAVDAFEDACATGDDALIAAAADHMEALESAHNAATAAYQEKAAKIAAKSEQQRARREAAKRTEQDEIGELIEAGADWRQAEAEVVAKRTGKNEADVLEAINKREWMRSEGFTTGGFESALNQAFTDMVEELYMEAENATNGFMVKKEYALKFNPKKLWSCNDSTARKVMSEEMANWFDEHGRITKPVLRAMILDGDTNWRKRTVMDEDYLQ